MRERININENWKFFLGDLAPKTNSDDWGGAKAKAFNFGAAAASLNDGGWRTVDIPHDFVMEGDYTRKHTESGMQKIPEMESMDSRHFAGGALEGGIGWYRRRFDTPNECEGKRIYIHFDGVYRDSTVYLNEYYIGRHESGYTSFYYDITDFVNLGGENILAVRVDASGREGWWYEGGGIYRGVWLEYCDNVSVEPWSGFISAKPDLKTGAAEINISAKIRNFNFESREIAVETLIYDKDGQTVGKVCKNVLADAWDSADYSDRTKIQNAHLWDLGNPYLYSALIRLYQNGEMCDEVKINFGIRETRFDADTGFYLNGRNIKIKGLCCHHDSAGIGIASNDSVQEYRVSQMKSMGAKAIRIAHHMPSDGLLDICDKMGLLVFDETRRMSSAPEDLECLRTMVKHARNHPSVFLYGIGNEEVFSQDKPETARTTLTMKAEIKKLDPARAVTAAVVCWNGKERFDTAEAYVDITKNLDIMGFNYCMTAWDDYHKRVPEQPVIITEASSNSGTRGCYSTNENIGQYYILDPDNGIKCKNAKKAQKKDMGESEWKYFARRQYASGIFLWTGMDYRGEPTPLSYPAVYSQFGIFDYCGFPKDNFYYYKSWWTDEPTLHIFPHWNFCKKEGEKITMHCYSNADEVELFVNGKSCGRKTMKRNWYLTWEDVVYEAGEVTAKGYINGEEIITKTVRTTGEPLRIELMPYKSEIFDGETAIINVRVTDEDGATVPTADNEIHFNVSGGVFLGTGNGNPGSHESDKLPVRRAFNGLCQLLVKAAGSEICVTASSQGLETAVCRVKVK